MYPLCEDGVGLAALVDLDGDGGAWARAARGAVRWGCIFWTFDD